MPLPLSYNLRNLRQRWHVTLLALGGIALVVAVFVALAAMDAGLRTTLAATGRSDNAIVVQKGSQSELTSGIGLVAARVLMLDERVARDETGTPLASPEVLVVANLPRQIDGADTNVVVRGVSARAFDVRGGVRLLSGRRLQAGLRELMTGRRLSERFGLGVGATLRLQRKDWTVVGVFASQGSAFESEIWGDLDSVAAAFQRRGGYQSVTVRLSDPRDLPSFKANFEDDPRMQVQVEREDGYYAGQTGALGDVIRILGRFISFVMGIGAVFGAMNTMYAIVAARTREVGTLRALGFSRRSIVAAFLIESTLLALAGGLLGCALAWPAHGLGTAAGGANFAELAFAFRVTPQALAAGMTFALVMGILGGLLPALRAARLPISAALREA